MKKIVLLVLLITFSSCKKVERGNEIDSVTVLEGSPTVTIEVDSTKIEKPEVYRRIWSASDLKLPKGKIISMDCSGCTTDKPDHENNYLVIRDADSIMVIRRDVDIDTYLAVRVGDLIR